MSNDAQLDAIKSGYTFEGATVNLGVALSNGEPQPDVHVSLPLAMMNRHGLIAGATGTGKTKTLQVLAEQLSANGVPVFMADVKGDLSGIAAPGESNDKLAARMSALGQTWQGTSYPAEFFTLGDEGTGVPIRATIESFGPILLSRVLDLNSTQESALQLIFHYADQKELELYNLADLRAVIQFLTSAEGKAELENLGGVSKATAGVILRGLVTLEADGMDKFFGEPEFDTAEFLRTASDGRGMISILELANLQSKPQLFSTFLMWLLADLFEDLPEVGDVEKPKLVFFLDEAHLLFNGSSKAFKEAITQTVRLIRSKGVGLFFITQTPKDVPAEVLGQLANRVQHALRTFTPDDQKALVATAKTFPKSAYDLEEVLTTAGIGEAIVTVMTETGAPSPVALTRMYAPQSFMGPAPEAPSATVNNSTLNTKYATVVDSVSAFEKLTQKAEATQQEAASAQQSQANDSATKEAEKRAAAEAKEAEKRAKEEERERQKRNDAVMRVGTNIATTLGREIVRSIFGTKRSGRKGGLGGLF